MWVVEVNVLGRRFTHRVEDHSERLGIPQRLPAWRPWSQDRPRTAA